MTATPLLPSLSIPNASWISRLWRTDEIPVLRPAREVSQQRMETPDKEHAWIDGAQEDHMVEDQRIILSMLCHSGVSVGVMRCFHTIYTKVISECACNMTGSIICSAMPPRTLRLYSSSQTPFSGGCTGVVTQNGLHCLVWR